MEAFNRKKYLEDLRAMLVLTKVRYANTTEQFNSVQELRNLILANPYVPQTSKDKLIEQELKWKSSIEELEELIKSLEKDISELELYDTVITELEALVVH